MHEEKRQFHRYPVTCELKGKVLKPAEGTGPSGAAGRALRGVIVDMGAGGLGLFSDDTIEISDPFLCEIKTPQMPVGIPTLLQVRWALKDGQGHTYKVGLQFLV